MVRRAPRSCKQPDGRILPSRGANFEHSRARKADSRRDSPGNGRSTFLLSRPSLRYEVLDRATRRSAKARWRKRLAGSSSGDIEEFRALLTDVQAGSQEAAWTLVDRYSAQILRCVRRRLPTALRSKFDSDDYVQAVWLTVFNHRSRLARHASPAEFVAFIGEVANNKVRQEVRKRLRYQKFNVNREQPLDDSQAPDQRLPQATGETPSRIADARERWFRLVQDLPSHYRRFIELRFAGKTYREIAEESGYDPSTVERALHRIFRNFEDT